MLSEYFNLISDYTGFSVIGLLVIACIVLLFILVLKRG